MGEAFIPRKINSNTFISSYATIAVTYPAGSSCTCTNGTIILNDSDTNGEVVFAIPEAGNWTVSCSNGTDSKSQSVSIISKGQCEEVILLYKKYLFKAGEGVVADWTCLKGGYTGANASASSLTLSGGTSWYWSATAAVTSNNTIDLSGYNKLVVDVQTNMAATSDAYAWVGVSADKFTRGPESSTISIDGSIAYTKINTTARSNVEVNIADISRGYVFVASYGMKINTTAYNIWLE